MSMTLVFVMIGWVLFRAPDLETAFSFYHGMIGLDGIAFSDAYIWQIKGIQIAALIGGIALVFAMPWLERKRTHVTLSKGSIAMQAHPNVIGQALVCALFVIAVSRLLAMSYSPFLYFQF